MKSKFLIFPIILLFTFIIAYLTLDYYNKKNKLLIGQTRNILFPGIELSIKLNNKLSQIQYAFQNYVASGNDLQLEKADSIAKSLISLYSHMKKKGIKISESVNIIKLFEDYYTNVRNVSKEMIDSDISKELETKIDQLLSQYNEINGLLKKFESDSKERARAHFMTIEVNNKRSAKINLLIILAGFLVSLLVSHYYSKAIAKPLKELNNMLWANEKELKLLNEELSTSNESLNIKNEELHSTLLVLKDTQSQLVQSEKMACVGVLTSGIAHEINNPLNFILGGINAIESVSIQHSQEDINEIEPFIQIIKTGVERISNIVTSLNRFNRNTGNNEVCDIHSIIDNCFVILENKLKHKAEIKKKYSASPCHVIGNEGKFHQAFINILTNAEQAIENKGTISVTTEIEAEHLRIIISDTGKGIKQEHLNKITEPFFTTKAPGKGTGLGLSIAYSIINEQKGRLAFFSEFGKGTSVVVTLPINKFI